MMRVFCVMLFGIVLASSSRTAANPLGPVGGASALSTVRVSGPSLALPDRSVGYKILYAFKCGSADGDYPQAGLTAVNGELYGATSGGGSGTCGSGGFGCGTVFKVSTSGTERVIYSFKDFSDGVGPAASLLAANGELYGTTESGGGGGTCGSGASGCETIFEVTTSGIETVLHRFNGRDGSTPISTPVLMNGNLYGTTQAGGGTTCPSGTTGCGTVFELRKSGKLHVLYSFTGGTDGSNPYAGLIASNGALYGTAQTEVPNFAEQTDQLGTTLMPAL